MKDNFSDLWHQQSSEAPGIKELVSKTIKMKRNSISKLILVNVMMLTTIIFLCCFWYFFRPEMITSHIGLLIMISGMLLYVLYYNRMYSKLKSINENNSNSDFLKKIIDLKSWQKFLQTRMLRIYFVALTVGITMYLYEYVSKMPSPYSLLAYGLLLVWIAFNWFYLRPKIIKKDRDKMDVIIQGFENIRSQM